MAIISQQNADLYKMLKRMDEGTITTQELTDRCKVHTLIHKNAQLALNAMTLSLQNGMTQKKMHQVGLMGKHEVIKIGVDDTSKELIECPDLDEVINRADCLDFSGDAKNTVSCRSCKQFNITRDLLMGKGD